MLIRFVSYIQLAPPLIAEIIMTTTMTIVFTSSRLFNLLFNIVRCSKNEYTALLKINKELFQPHPRSLSKREGGRAFSY